MEAEKNRKLDLNYDENYELDSDYIENNPPTPTNWTDDEETNDDRKLDLKYDEIILWDPTTYFNLCWMELKIFCNSES